VEKEQTFEAYKSTYIILAVKTVNELNSVILVF